MSSAGSRSGSESTDSGFEEIPKKGLQGDVPKSTRSHTVADNVKNDFPGESTEEQSPGKARKQRAPTAQKGSEKGSSAAKRIRQTELREKAQGKGK